MYPRDSERSERIRVALRPTNFTYQLGGLMLACLLVCLGFFSRKFLRRSAGPGRRRTRRISWQSWPRSRRRRSQQRCRSRRQRWRRRRRRWRTGCPWLPTAFRWCRCLLRGQSRRRSRRRRMWRRRECQWQLKLVGFFDSPLCSAGCWRWRHFCDEKYLARASMWWLFCVRRVTLNEERSRVVSSTSSNDDNRDFGVRTGAAAQEGGGARS